MMRAPVTPARLGSSRVLPCSLPQQSEGWLWGGDPCQPRMDALRAGAALGTNWKDFVALETEPGQRLCSANEFIQGADRGQTIC